VSWFSGILSSGVDKVVDSVADGLDKLFTSDDERNRAKIELEKIRQASKLELEKEANRAEQIAQENVTERWNIDKDGNFITKSIRPLTLAYLMVVITILAMFDGNIKIDEYEFVIKSEWVDLFKQAFLVVLGAFFIGKSYERAKGRVV
jgi:predicted PurR-regulated permease PerM